MRIKEYEIKQLCNDLKQVMQDIGQSSAIAISGLVAIRLYEMGWRRQDKFDEVNECGYNLGLIDGAKQFAEKLKQCSYCDNDFMDDKQHKFIFIEDIEKITKELLKNDK